MQHTITDETASQHSRPAILQLAQYPQWVLYRIEERNGELTKVPYDAKTGRPAKANDPSTWSTYDQAAKRLETSKGYYAGLGFETSLESGIIGGDLDACFNESGELASWAADIVRRLATYAEYSPSGRGLRFFVYGSIPRSLKKYVDDGIVRAKGEKKPAIELYNQGHYLTITGHHYSGTPDTIEDRHEEIEALYAELDASRKPQVETPRPVMPSSLSDQELLTKARNANNGAKFAALWDGNTAGYPSQSEADMALCNMLAFWTGRDAAAMDRLFRSSRLFRVKWDSRRGETTYGANTIREAIQDCRETYAERKPSASEGYSKTPTVGAEKAPAPAPDVSMVDQAIEKKDLDQLFEHAPLLAQLTRSQYVTYKRQIKAVFGKQINLNDLDSVVNEERKAADPVGERLDLDHVAQAFYEQYGDRWAYDIKRDSWRHWIGTHWAEPQTVKSGVYDIDELIVNLLHEFNVDVKSNGTLDCVHRLARGKCKKDFTPTSDLVNFKNGTLHITTMELIPHCKDDELLYCLDYAYAPGEHPHTSAFLQETLCIIQEGGTREPDYHAIQAYMAHIGLALIGDTSMHNFCILYGARRAGKSTLLRLGNAVTGHSISKYADYAGDSLFSSELEGKRARYTRNSQRLVCADEVSPDALRAEGILKNMTAHSGVEMRGMNKDEETGNQWRPKLLLSTNDFPHYKDTAGAIKERVIYLHAPYTRPEQERNPMLFEKQLLPELSAFAHSCIVLAKTVLDRWYYPRSINMKRLSNAAETNGSALKAFLEEYCVIARGAICPTGVLYEKLKTYREENGHSKNYSKLSMVSDLKDMNAGIMPGGKAERYEGKPQKLLHGIRLREENEDISEGPALTNDPLLLPSERNDCNDRVTINRNNRYTSQNGSTGSFIPSKNGHCNDVTIKTEKSSLRDPYLNGDKGIGVSRETVKGQKIVTSLQDRVNKPLVPSEVCNDSKSASLQTVTPIVTPAPSDSGALFEAFEQIIIDEQLYMWDEPGTRWSGETMPGHVVKDRLEACLSGSQAEYQSALRLARKHLQGRSHS